MDSRYTCLLSANACSRPPYFLSAAPTVRKDDANGGEDLKVGEGVLGLGVEHLSVGVAASRGACGVWTLEMRVSGAPCVQLTVHGGAQCAIPMPDSSVQDARVERAAGIGAMPTAQLLCTATR